MKRLLVPLGGLGGIGDLGWCSEINDAQAEMNAKQMLREAWVQDPQILS